MINSKGIFYFVVHGCVALFLIIDFTVGQDEMFTQFTTLAVETTKQDVTTAAAADATTTGEEKMVTTKLPQTTVDTTQPQTTVDTTQSQTTVDTTKAQVDYDAIDGTTMEFTTELSTERGMGLCMDKAIYHDNSCCFYTGNIYDYAGGKAACESLKGHLIKLVPLELYNMLKQFYSPQDIPDSWIGLKLDDTDSTIYVWDVDGEVLSTMQSNWDVNEPNLPCVYIIGITGHWKTSACEEELYDAICCVPETMFNGTTTLDSPPSGSSSRSSSNSKGSSSSSSSSIFVPPVESVDPCEETECEGINVECDEATGSCVCDDGFEWVDENMENCKLVDPECEEGFIWNEDNEECEAMEPECEEGFIWNEDNEECEDVDECMTGTDDCMLRPNTECENNPGSYECNCKDGFSVDVSDGQCKQNPECHPSRNPCRMSNENCNSINGNFMCVCDRGFARDPVTNECEAVPPCSPPNGDPCRIFDHKVCVEVPGDPNTGERDTFRCDCKEFYSPDPANPGSCKRVPDDQICEAHPCDNGGTCTVADDSEIIQMSCSCTDSFEGEFCEEPRNLQLGEPQAVMQGLMIGAIVAAALLIGLLAACCCLCACLPACRTPPPKPAPLTYRPVARPRQLMRRYIIDGYEERWIPEERRIVEEDVVIEEPVEETREHYYLESSRYSDVESGEEADETQRLNLLRNVLHRTSRNPLHLQRNQGYVHPQGSPGTSEFSRPYTADGSVNG